VETHTATAARCAKAEGIAVLERFYAALCGLVEKQRISDPLSLMMVQKVCGRLQALTGRGWCPVNAPLSAVYSAVVPMHLATDYFDAFLPARVGAPTYQVKELLEGGACLHRPLLQQLLDAVAAFTHDCGLVRFNRFALPLLVFVRKVVGVGPRDFEEMVSMARLHAVLFPEGDDGATWGPSGAASKGGSSNSGGGHGGSGGGGGCPGGGGGGGGGGSGGGGHGGSGDSDGGGDDSSGNPDEGVERGASKGTTTAPAGVAAAAGGAVATQDAGDTHQEHACMPKPQGLCRPPIKLQCEPGSPGATRAHPPDLPPQVISLLGPIDVALAAASRQITQAIVTARSQRPGGGKGAPPARVPGVARASTPAAAAAVNGGAREDGGAEVVGADDTAAAQGAVEQQHDEAEELPGLGLDEDEAHRPLRSRCAGAGHDEWKGPPLGSPEERTL
jgi:hypothetical protein